MTYKVEGQKIFVGVNRASIIDITANDTLEVMSLPGAHYTWTDHDTEFLENNPDDDIFLEVERTADNQYKVTRVLFEEAKPLTK